MFVVDGTQFSAPLVRIAQGPEMCASYTFPRLFGTVVADDLLIKGIIVDTMFLAKHGFGVSFADRETA